MSLESDWDSATPVKLKADWEAAGAKPAQATQKPSLVDQASSILKGAYSMTPGGLVAQGLEEIDKAANYAGGVATDAAAKVLPPEVAGGIGTAVNIGLPSALGGLAGRAALTPAMQAGAKDLMMSALKGTKLEKRAGDVERGAETMFRAEANVSEGGVKKLQGLITGLNDDLQTALNASPATVDKNAIAARLQKVIQEIEASSFNPQERVKAVEKIYNDVLGNHLLPNQIPVAVANKIKSGIYKELGDIKYKRMRSGDPVSDSEKAQMALARGAKEEIGAAVPESASLNAQMSSLINASNLAENAVSAGASRNPGGLAWLTHDLPRFLAMVFAQHPTSKSIVARELMGASKRGGAEAGVAAGEAISGLRERK